MIWGIWSRLYSPVYNMADEDEVDVLGDFNLDNLFSKEDGRLTSCYDGSVLGSQGSELLQCDYGITHNWLLEGTTQPCWYTGSDDAKSLHTDDRQHFVFSNSLSSSDPSPTSSHWMDNDSWSDKEKTLLEKGLDLFGRSWVRLSQFIGSKSSHQVKTYVRSHHHHFGPSEDSGQIPFSSESDRCNSGVFSFTELIDDMQIPASMEEVIAVVSTAQPTIPSIPKRNVATSSPMSQGSTAGSSGDTKKKSDYHGELMSRGKSRRSRPQVLSRTHTIKKSSKVNRRPGRKPGVRLNIQRSNSEKLKQQVGIGGKIFSETDSFGTVSSNCRVGIILSTGEEVVRIQKESSHDSDEDGEIEIEESADDFLVEGSIARSSEWTNDMDIKTSTSSTTAETCDKKTNIMVSDNNQPCKVEIKTETDENSSDIKLQEKMCVENVDMSSEQVENLNTFVSIYDDGDSKSDLKEMTYQYSVLKDWNDGRECGKGNSYSTLSHQDILESIFNLPAPTKEFILDPNVIMDEEKAIHAEFFEGRSAKTPKRYLKIRNHILECWHRSRPAYVTKTSVRTGLKNCGDVNCIGRIHAYLEQIGAINFGCEQARYTRPLYLVSDTGTYESEIVSTSGQGREKLRKEQLAAQHQARIDAMRPRKKKLDEDYWFPMADAGGYTITHSEDGEAVHTTVVMPDSHKNIRRARATKMEPIKLIYCNKFSDSKPAPYAVELHIESLLVMDVHAHSSHSEVIGLLGGYYDSRRLVLQIWRAVACRSSSSGVHCDMCPVSQTEASERLQAEGFEIVGWYHSHPTFSPNPSLQDLDTQSHMQDWFAKTASAPLVGFILSPYCPTSRSLASEYRCVIVESENELTPYRLTVDVISSELNTCTLLSRMDAIFTLHQESSEALVDFNLEFNSHPPISYTEKCLASARQHLRSCLPSVSEDVKQSILENVLQACNTLILLKQSKKEQNTEKPG